MSQRRVVVALVVVAACGARTELGTANAPTIDASTHDAHADVSVSAACSNAVVTLVTTSAEPDAIAVDDVFVYWHDSAGISRMPKNGGPVKVVEPAPPSSPWWNVAAFALAGENVFFADVANAAMVAKSGGLIVALPISLMYGRCAATPTHAYFWSWTGTSTNIFFVAADGTGLAALPSLPALANHIAFDGDVAAFVGANAGVYDVELPSGPTVLMSGLAAADIGVDHARVYFVTIDGTNGSKIDAVDRETFATQPFADTSGASSLVLSPTDIYFTTTDRVRKIVGKSPTSIVDVASTGGDLEPVAITVDGACVYWTNASRTSVNAPGAIMVAPL